MRLENNIVVFLQNAWSPLYAGRVWPRQSWPRALAASRSGQRLRHLVEDFDKTEEAGRADFKAIWQREFELRKS